MMSTQYINFGGIIGTLSDDGTIRFGGLVGRLVGTLDNGTIHYGGTVGTIVNGVINYGGIVGSLVDGVLSFGGVVGTIGDAPVPPPPDGDQFWAFVKILMHFDGPNGSTTITEEKGRTVTVDGAAALAAVGAKYGSAGLASTDYYNDGVTIANSPAADPGASDFCVECWVKVPALGADNQTYLFSPTFGTEPIRVVLTSANTLCVASINDIGTLVQLDSALWAGTFPGTGYHHLAFTRSGDTLRLFVDGELVDTDTYSGSIPTNGTAFIHRPDVGVFTDELRYTVGAARYVAPFTPPAAAFPNFGP